MKNFKQIHLPVLDEKYRVSQKSFRLLNLNIFRSTKSTKINEVFSEIL